MRHRQIEAVLKETIRESVERLEYNGCAGQQASSPIFNSPRREL